MFSMWLLSFVAIVWVGVLLSLIGGEVERIRKLLEKTNN